MKHNVHLTACIVPYSAHHVLELVRTFLQIIAGLRAIKLNYYYTSTHVAYDDERFCRKRVSSPVYFSLEMTSSFIC